MSGAPELVWVLLFPTNVCTREQVDQCLAELGAAVGITWKKAWVEESAALYPAWVLFLVFDNNATLEALVNNPLGKEVYFRFVGEATEVRPA